MHCIHAICTGLYWWTWSDLIFNRNTLLINCTTLPGYPWKQCHQKSVRLFLEQGYFNKKKKIKIKSSIFHNFTLQLFSSMSSPAWPYISPSHWQTVITLHNYFHRILKRFCQTIHNCPHFSGLQILRFGQKASIWRERLLTDGNAVWSCLCAVNYGWEQPYIYNHSISIFQSARTWGLVGRQQFP